MKRFIGIACIVAVAAFASGASAERQMYAGIKGGINVADLTGDDVVSDSTDTATAFLGGAFIGCNFNSQFGARLEALYVRKGAKVTEGTEEYTDKLDYLEFPLLFVAHIPAGEKFCFDLYAGPTFGFNVKAEESNDETVDIKDFVKSFEFGGAAGVGGEYKLTSFSIVGDARFAMGATSAAEDNPVTGESIDKKTRNIEVMLGVSFPFGGAE